MTSRSGNVLSSFDDNGAHRQSSIAIDTNVCSESRLSGLGRKLTKILCEFIFPYKD